MQAVPPVYDLSATTLAAWAAVTTMPTAKCLMANGGALMTAMYTLWPGTESAPHQHMSSSTVAVMKLSKSQVQ